MSILRLKKCAIIAVNTIMSIWLIRAILFFVKTEHGKPILSNHIEDVKALIYILDTFEYIAFFSFAYILVLLYMLINTYIRKCGGVKALIMLVLMQFTVICVCVLSWLDVTFSLKFNGDRGLEDTIDILLSLILILTCEFLHHTFLYKLIKKWFSRTSPTILPHSTHNATLPPRICHQYHQRNHSHIHSPKTHIAEVVCQTFPTNRF